MATTTDAAAGAFKLKLRVGGTAVRVHTSEDAGGQQQHQQQQHRPRRAARREVDYRQLESFGTELQKGTNFAELLESKHSRIPEATEEIVRHPAGSQVTAAWMEADGFTKPLLVSDSHTIPGLRMPGSDFNVQTVLADVGGKRELDVIEVATQSELLPKWTLAEWADYFAKPASERPRILNVISLEVSNTPLRARISSPAAVRAIDWIDTVWPREAEDGVVPAVQYYCLDGDTRVTLASGVSMHIKDLEMLPDIFTLGEQGAFLASRPSAHLVRGRKECIELSFSDGRTLVCTPDHEIRTTEGWCRAQDLVSERSRVIMGLDAPLYDPTEDEPFQLQAFEIELDGLPTVHMKDARGVARAHALARILGHVSSQQGHHQSNASVITLENLTDAEQVNKDVKLVTGTRSNVKKTTPKNFYHVNLPSSFATLIASLRGLLLERSCPKSFVREFLGAFFGASAAAPSPNRSASQWTPIELPLSDPALSDQIVSLLKRFDIEKVCHISADALCVSLEGIPPFQERIGFRYSCLKQQRLSVAAAFLRSASPAAPLELSPFLDAAGVFRSSAAEAPRCWTTTFVAAKPVGLRDVFDLSVPVTENFLANGLTVHNCLMSVAGSYTDFHVDFGGSSVWYHVVRGEKIFYLVPPTVPNLAAFEHWCSSPRQAFVFFGDQVPQQCFRVRISAGQTLFIPSGWIHAVFTPVDSLVFGGNFVHSLAVEMQLGIAALEARTFVPSKFRFPYFERIHWYAAKKMAERFEAVARGLLPGRPLLPVERTGYAALARQLQTWLDARDENAAPPSGVPEPTRLLSLLLDYTSKNAPVSEQLNAPPLLPLPPPPPLKLRLSLAATRVTEETTAAASPASLAMQVDEKRADLAILAQVSFASSPAPAASATAVADEAPRVVLKLKKPLVVKAEEESLPTLPRKRLARRTEDDFEYGAVEAASDEWNEEEEPEAEIDDEDDEDAGRERAEAPKPSPRSASAASKASPVTKKAVNKKSAATTARQRLQQKIGFHGSTARSFPTKR